MTNVSVCVCVCIGIPKKQWRSLRDYLCLLTDWDRSMYVCAYVCVCLLTCVCVCVLVEASKINALYDKYSGQNRYSKYTLKQNTYKTHKTHARTRILTHKNTPKNTRETHSGQALVEFGRSAEVVQIFGEKREKRGLDISNDVVWSMCVCVCMCAHACVCIHVVLCVLCVSCV